MVRGEDQGEERINRRIRRNEGDDPPGFVDDFLPTDPVTLSFFDESSTGAGRQTVGSKFMGSYEVYEVLGKELYAGSPDTFGILKHSRLGTIDTVFVEAAGVDSEFTPTTAPLDAMGTPGTITLDLGSTSTGNFYSLKYQLHKVPRMQPR